MKTVIDMAIRISISVVIGALFITGCKFESWIWSYICYFIGAVLIDVYHQYRKTNTQ